MTKKPSEPRTYDNSRRQASAIAGPCQCCKAHLANLKPPREQKTRVYARRGPVAYCVCDNCGATWKAVDKVS